MSAKLSSEQKHQIVILHKSGHGIREISRLIGCSHSTVSFWVNRHKNNGNVKRKRGSGPKRKTSAAEDRLIVRQCSTSRFKPATEIRDELKETHNINISVVTVRRRLREAGFYGRRPAKKPLLTAKMKKARLEWAKSHKDWTIEEWKNVVWSDESKFNIGGSDGMDYVRRKSKERYAENCTRPTVRATVSQMIWGCFSFYGIGRLCLIEGNINAKKYKNILKRHLIPSIEEHLSMATDVVFQDDCAPCHRARSIVEYAQQLGLKTMNWPGNSPDLNPIENLWRVMKVNLRQKHPKNADELKKYVEEIWNNDISDDLLKNLVQSMPERIKAVLKAKGGHTKY